MMESKIIYFNSVATNRFVYAFQLQMYRIYYRGCLKHAEIVYLY